MRQKLLAMILAVSHEIGQTEDMVELQRLYILANGLWAQLNQYPEKVAS